MAIIRLFIHTLVLVFCISFTSIASISWAGISEKDYWEEVGVLKIDKTKPVPAPPFTLNSIDGRKVSLRDFRGKVVFLNFWTTWCPPCIYEMPSMEALHKRFKNRGLVVLAVNSEEGVKKVNSFIKRNGYTFLVVLDTDGSVINDSYRAVGLPTTYLIGRTGNLIGKAEGARQWDSEESLKLMEEILKQ